MLRASVDSPRLLVLLVGDDLVFLDPMADRLVTAGYRAQRADTLPSVWRQVIEEPPFAIVIDASRARAPWRPWELCRELAVHRAYLIALALADNCSRSRTKAFQHGADHCFCKLPPESEELLAYLDARRPSPLDYPVRSGPGHPQAIQTVKIDLENSQVSRGGRRSILSPKERTLLGLLLQHAGRTVPTDEIYGCLWVRRSRASCRANLKQIVRRLREKMELNPSRPKHLLSVRGLGYRIILPPAT